MIDSWCLCVCVYTVQMYV